MLNVFLFILVFITTYFGVEWFRRWSLRKKLYDFPNERSSHKTPTPLGGGLIIGLVTNIFFIASLWYLSKEIPLLFLIGGNLIALISWLDDLYSIPSFWRFLIHSGGAVLAIYSLGFYQTIYIPFSGELGLGFLGAIITFLWIVWLTNAFNFMDGIDGIAGVQALTAGLGWLFVSFLLQLKVTGILGGVLAFSSLGFLIHNWEPAKIFMGDVGSAFLGYAFAAMPLLALNETTTKYSSIMPYIAILLVFLFVGDSFLTFIRRLFKGEKVWQAHREHFYQKLVIKGYSHKSVTLIYGIISLLLKIILLIGLFILES